MTTEANEAQDGEAQALVFDFELPAPPEKVWRALTIPALLERWLPDDEARTEPVKTEVLEAEPPRHLRWSWREAGAEPGIVTFTLEANDNGGTALRLVHERRAPAPPLPANGNATMMLAA